MKINDLFQASYAITISPSPATQSLLSRGSIAVRCTELLDMLGHYLYAVRKHIEIVGVFELGKTKSLHLHLKLTFMQDSAKIAFDKSIRYRLERIGFVNVKTNVNSGWTDYMGKEVDYMAKLGVQPFRTEDFNDSWSLNYNMLALKRRQKKKVKYPKQEPDRVQCYQITDFALEWKEESSNSIDDDQLIYHGRLMDELVSPSRRGACPPRSLL